MTDKTGNKGRQITAVEYIAYIGNTYGIGAMEEEYELIKDNKSVKENPRFWSEVIRECTKRHKQDTAIQQVNNVWNF